MKPLTLLLFALPLCGAVEVKSLAPGAVTDLAGAWEFRPGFQQNYVRVPVPQMLSRIQWWLDDSEDFKAWEDARLKRLGFDTDRAEDGWYRLELNVPALPPGRHVFVEFDGVAMTCRTYLNEHLLGEHAGMFSRFAYDLTPHLKPGRNVLTMFVSMEKMAGSTHSVSEAVTVNLTAAKVMSMSKGMFGPLTPNRPNRDYDAFGIWQPARLVVRGEAAIEDAWFIPTLSGADVRVETRALGTVRKAVVKARWEGLGTAAPVEVEPGRTATLRLREVKPRLWTPADPNLYRMEVRLETPAGELLDRYVRKVGFRTFEARGNQLCLNGHPYWLRGANQLPYGKNPWDPRLARRLIGLLHDNNIRITRTHAMPWNEAWLDAADEIGLGVSIEGIRPWALAGLIGMPPKAIADHWLMENADVVRRIRNHPSVLIWTVGNEMMLRDAKNLDKWRLLSDVVKQTRALDPYRPVVCSSEYTRDPEFYEKVLKPAGIDDGDIDDIHRYRGWYTESPFVTGSRFEAEMKRNRGARPFIGQEMSTGYPDLDTGLPVARYTRDMATPQAWVGAYAEPGHDAAVFLEHDRAVTKRWAEQLRFERGAQTAGFLMFSAECWFRHSYEPESVQPYPVVEAMRYAWAPLGLALETGRRRFFSGEEVDTAVFVTNDDERFRDYRGLRVEVSAGATAPLASLPYHATVRVPVRLKMPAVAEGRRRIALVTRLMQDGRELSRTVDPVEVFAPVAPVDLSRALPPGADLSGLAPGGELRKRVEAGQTVLVLSPGKAIVDLFPQDVESTRAATGEFADWSPAAGTPVAVNLEKMDLKWWARRNDARLFVNSSAHRLKTGGRARELVRFIPAHSYIPAEKKAGMYYSVLFEIPLGRGRLLVCDLDVLESMDVDPAARLFARNLAAAAR
jgi:antitoxin (DNA-binding transcriptional repressor) of toxin-antitoxin stability system